MAFQKLTAFFRTLFPKSSPSLALSTSEDIGPHTPVDPTERIARVIIREERISWSTPAIKEKLFEPDKHNELSVFRIARLNDAEVETLTQAEVADPQEKRVIGWGYFPASVVSEAYEGLHLDLTSDPEYEAHPRHANIRGWPTGSDLELRKSALRSAMIFLKDKAQLHLTPHGKAIEARKRTNRL